MAARAPLEVLVRPERPGDVAAIHEVNESAFGRPDEARLVESLRAQARPFLSLVAEADGDLAGNIVFTPVALDGFAALLMGLAPMAVRVESQRRGVGSALVRAGVTACRSLGAAAVVVLGHPEYYPKLGFVPAHLWGLRSEYEAAPEAFMAMELQPGALAGAGGTVRYHPAFAQI